MRKTKTETEKQEKKNFMYKYKEACAKRNWFVAEEEVSESMFVELIASSVRPAEKGAIDYRSYYIASKWCERP